MNRPRLSFFRSGSSVILALVMATAWSLLPLPVWAEDLPEVHMPSPRPLGHDFPVFNSEMDLPDLPELQNELTLEQARRLALLYNPTFQALAWELRARQAALLQAGLVPNPSVDLTTEELAAQQNVPQTTLTFSQPFLLGDKTGRLQTVSRLNAELSGWDFEHKRLEVLNDVTVKFIDVLQAQDSQHLSQELETVAEETLNTIQHQVDAHKVSPLEAARAQVVLANSKLDVEDGELALEQAREDLASVWGGGGSDFEHASGQLELTLMDLPAFATLLKALNEHPDIARWETEFAQRQAVLDFEQSRAYPDLTLSAALREHYDTHDLGINIGVTLDLPVWNRNQGNIAFASLRQQKALEERDRILFSLTADLRGAYQRLRRAHGRLQMLKETILPQAESTFLGIRKGYQEGKFSYLEVLESQRNFFEARAQAVTAVGDFYRALSEVEFLTGEELTKIGAHTENGPAHDSGTPASQ